MKTQDAYAWQEGDKFFMSLRGFNEKPRNEYASANELRLEAKKRNLTVKWQQQNG